MRRLTLRIGSLRLRLLQCPLLGGVALHEFVGLRLVLPLEFLGTAFRRRLLRFTLVIRSLALLQVLPLLFLVIAEGFLLALTRIAGLDVARCLRRKASSRRQVRRVDRSTLLTVLLLRRRCGMVRRTGGNLLRGGGTRCVTAMTAVEADSVDRGVIDHPL